LSHNPLYVVSTWNPFNRSPTERRQRSSVIVAVVLFNAAAVPPASAVALGDI
jgi:hypothetical protein